MTASRVPAVIDALVAVLETAPGLAGVRVVDGPIVTSDPLKEVIFVGYDGDPEGDEQAADVTQEWAGLGAKARSETVQVTCAVVVWCGGTKVKPARDRVFELLAEVETALREDPSLGLPPPAVAQMATGQYFQAQRQSGIEARIRFTINVQTRI